MPVAPDDFPVHLITTGAFDPPAMLFTVGTTVLYLRGARRGPASRARRRRTATFLVGIGVVLVGQLSVIAVLSGQLFWVHMVQHLLLTVVAAPLLAWSSPVSVVRRALTPGTRHVLARATRRIRRVRHTVGDPHPLLPATAAHIGAVWLWHAPGMYDAAVRHASVHLLEHATLLGTAVWFWSQVWSSARRNPRTQAIATLCLAAMIVQGAVLGAALTFAGRPLVGVYTGVGGLSALQDQQFAGAIMWVPPGFVYATVAVRRFVGWLGAVESSGRPARAQPKSQPPTVRRNAS